MTSLPLQNYHIGIDLDHTTFNPLPAICTAVNEQYGTTLTPTDITAYELPIPGSTDNISKVIHQLHEREDFIQTMEPMPGSIDTIQDLADAGATISIVTHRHPKTFDWTRQALETHNVPYDNFVEQVPENKADLEDIDVLIDDLHAQVEGMAATNRDGILFLRPYNTENIPNHDRVHTALNTEHSATHLVSNPQTQWTAIPNIIHRLVNR